MYFNFQSQQLRDVLCKSVNKEKNLKTRDLVSMRTYFQGINLFALG